MAFVNKYNQKELQETGFYDYGWRQYMPDLGRWFGMDKLAETYNSHSPYAYVMNNPIMMYDPDGRWSEGYQDSLNNPFENAGWRPNHSLNPSYSGSSLFGFSSSGNTNYNSTLKYWTSSLTQGKQTFDFDFYGERNGEVQGDYASVVFTQMTVVDVNGWGADSRAWENKMLNNSVGQPGALESMIPIWGSGRAAVDHFQNGNYWTGAAYTALAISDVFLVKSIATGLSKGAWKLGSHSWSATRQWMMKKGYAGAGEPLHHWLITQKVSKKYGLEAVANQPWNLTKFGSQASHMRWAHGQMYQGIKYPFTTALYPITSTPTWFKVGAFSTLGHGAQLGSYQFSSEDY